MASPASGKSARQVEGTLAFFTSLLCTIPYSTYGELSNAEKGLSASRTQPPTQLSMRWGIAAQKPQGLFTAPYHEAISKVDHHFFIAFQNKQCLKTHPASISLSQWQKKSHKWGAKGVERQKRAEEHGSNPVCHLYPWPLVGSFPSRAEEEKRKGDLGWGFLFFYFFVIRKDRQNTSNSKTSLESSVITVDDLYF